MIRDVKNILCDLAINLKAERSKKGLSQEALAFAANVDRTYVSQIERGIGNPSIQVLAKLSKSLEIDLIELFVTNSI